MMPELEAALVAFITRHRLTDAEGEVVALAVDGVHAHKAIAEHFGVAPETVKKQSASICAKSGCATLREVVIEILRAALVQTRGAAA